MILTGEEILASLSDYEDELDLAKFARAIEQTILEKLGSPYGYICEKYSEDRNKYSSSFMYLKGSTEIYSEDGYRVTPLYKLPEVK